MADHTSSIVNSMTDVNPLIFRAAYDHGFADGQSSKLSVETLTYPTWVRLILRYDIFVIEDVRCVALEKNTYWSITICDHDSIYGNSSVDDFIKEACAECNEFMHPCIRAIKDHHTFQKFVVVQPSARSIDNSRSDHSCNSGGWR